MLLFMQPSQISSVHAKVPPIGYVSAFLHTWEEPQWELRSEDSKKAVTSALRLFREKYALDEKPLEPIVFAEEEKDISVFTPLYSFAWETTTGIVSFLVHYEHSDNTSKVTENLLPLINTEWAWSWDIWLDSNLIKYGKNTYTFDIITQGGEKQTEKKYITSEAEEITFGNTTMYLNPYIKEDGIKMVWQEDDFDGIPTDFFMKWCVQSEKEEKVLIKKNNEFQKIPACLSYSTKKEYLIYFDNLNETWGKMFADVSSPEEWILYKKFPLYQRRRWSLYQSLFFYNPAKKFAQIVKATWDTKDFETLIQHYDVRAWRNTLSLRQINGDQIEIENGYEKMILYYYKANESKRNVSFPWLRYKYYVLRSWSWRLINQWTLYHLDQKVRVPPADDVWPAFTLDARLYEDSVIVKDPFKHINFTISSLKRPKSITDAPKEDFDCKESSLGVYGYMWDERSYVYANDNVNLLWGWWDVDVITLEDNYGSTYEVEQVYAWYISATLEPQERSKEIWKTTYTLTGLDNDGNKLCEKKVELNILEVPIYN